MKLKHFKRWEILDSQWKEKKMNTLSRGDINWLNTLICDNPINNYLKLIFWNQNTESSWRRRALLWKVNSGRRTTTLMSRISSTSPITSKPISNNTPNTTKPRSTSNRTLTPKRLSSTESSKNPLRLSLGRESTEVFTAHSCWVSRIGKENNCLITCLLVVSYMWRMIKNPSFLDM